MILIKKVVNKKLNIKPNLKAVMFYETIDNNKYHIVSHDVDLIVDNMEQYKKIYFIIQKQKKTYCKR